jgi:hypothetical protein
MFNSIRATDLKQKVSHKVDASMKTNVKEVEAYVTGPVRNAKLGKSHWVVVYGDNGQLWLLKAQFISKHIEYILSQVKKSSINIVYCNTYYEINIHQHEFGQENSWRGCPIRQGKPSQTAKGIIFCVYM